MHFWTRCFCSLLCQTSVVSAFAEDSSKRFRGRCIVFPVFRFLGEALIRPITLIYSSSFCRAMCVGVFCWLLMRVACLRRQPLVQCEELPEHFFGWSVSQIGGGLPLSFSAVVCAVLFVVDLRFSFACIRWRVPGPTNETGSGLYSFGALPTRGFGGFCT